MVLCWELGLRPVREMAAATGPNPRPLPKWEGERNSSPLGGRWEGVRITIVACP